ncbi:MAG: nuclear transport factor 2 family protein [Pseudomonadota bacterium]
MRILAAIVAITLLAGCGRVQGLTEDDIDAITAIDTAYTEGWLKPDLGDQESAVMALFSDDATIAPGGGHPPLTGHKAIRGFWFPDDGPPTNTTLFEHEAESIDGKDGFAVLRGRYRLKFDYDGASYHQTGNYMMSLEQQNDKNWLITNLIWNDRRVDE